MSTEPTTNPETEERRPHADDLINLRRYFAKVLLDEAGACATSEDLRKALGHVIWLSAVTNRLLSSAVLSYCEGGTLPDNVKLTHSRRAIRLLDEAGTRVPGDDSGEVTRLLLQALLAERTANHADNAAHHAVLGLQ